MEYYDYKTARNLQQVCQADGNTGWIYRTVCWVWH